MPKKQSAPKPRQLVAEFDATAKEWVVKTSPGRYRVFMTQGEAERFCVRESARRKKSARYHQELPQRSAWTGAPWDRSFKYIK